MPEGAALGALEAALLLLLLLLLLPSPEAASFFSSSLAAAREASLLAEPGRAATGTGAGRPGPRPAPLEAGREPPATEPLALPAAEGSCWGATGLKALLALPPAAAPLREPAAERRALREGVAAAEALAEGVAAEEGVGGEDSEAAAAWQLLLHLPGPAGSQLRASSLALLLSSSREVSRLMQEETSEEARAEIWPVRESERGGGNCASSWLLLLLPAPASACSPASRALLRTVAVNRALAPRLLLLLLLLLGS